MRAYALALAIGLSGCGALDGSAKSESTEVPAEVVFQGFVQRAFTLKVNGKSFNDSEHFYTRFIQDLILTNPEYKAAFKGAKVEVEGEYGLERFGANVGVFMSSEGATGHLFQATTDSQGKFSAKVEPKALDESFKARIVLRIGLQITQADKSVERFCYMLYSTKNGIKVSESSKPVIFDDFSTQLNTYQCSSVQERDLIIPTKAGSGSAPDGETPAEVKKEPSIKLGPSVEIALPFEASEQGEKRLLSVAALDGRPGLLLVQSEVSNLTDGQKYFPTREIELTDGKWSVKTTQRGVDPKGGLFPIGERNFVHVKGNGYGSSLLDADWNIVGGSTNTVEGLLNIAKGPSGVLCPAGANKYLFQFGGDYGYSRWTLNLDNPKIFEDPKALSAPTFPALDFQRLEIRNGGACVGSDVMFLGQGDNYLYRLNTNGVVQEKIAISRLLFSKAEFDSLRIVGVGAKLYLVVPSAAGVRVIEAQVQR